MGIGKILGIGLATVGSLGLIGGITAAVVTKQNATTSLNTVNSNEDKTTLVNKQEDKKEEANAETIKQNKELEEERSTQTVKTEKKETTSWLEEYNKKFGGECSGLNKDNKTSKPSHCQVL